MVKFTGFIGIATASTVLVLAALHFGGVVDLREATTNRLGVPSGDRIASKTPAPEKPDVVAKLAPEQPLAAAPQLAPESRTPAIDVLRLETDGSMIVAGSAAPDAEIELKDGTGRIVGKARADGNGDFVILPEENLEPGDHVVHLESRDAGGEPRRSAQTGVLSVPARGKQNVLAMVSEEGVPSRITVTPQSLEAPVEPKIVDTAEPAPADRMAALSGKVAMTGNAPVPASDEPGLKRQQVEEAAKPVAAPEPAIEPAPATPSASATPAAPTTPLAPTVSADAPAAARSAAPASQAAPAGDTESGSVRVEAVEIENDRLYVAGAAPQGRNVRVYIDDKPVGIARGTKDNRFVLGRDFPLSAGEHNIRVDLLGKSPRKVVARAEVPLVHEPDKSEPTAQQIAGDTTVRTGTSVIIRPGDSLWRISRKSYGRGIRYTTIYEANRDQIRNPNRIYIGQIFKIPDGASDG